MRPFLPHAPGERNRGPLSADLLSDSSSAALRSLAQQKLRPSLSLAELEQAAPAGVNDDAPEGRRPELASLARLRPAAVLLPIVDRPGGLSVLLTLRAADLRAHSGQVAFPGGKIDAGETPREAALREAHEEIGLEERFVEPLGWLDPYFTGTGFRVAPLVALVEPLVCAHGQQARSRPGVRNAVRLSDGRGQSSSRGARMAGTAAQILRHAP